MADAVTNARRPGAGIGRELGQAAGGGDPAVADLLLAVGGEPPADRRPGQVDQRVHAAQQVGPGIFRPPVALPRVPGQPADQPDDVVPAGAQQRGQRGADQPAGPGDRDGQRLRGQLSGTRLGGQVIGKLPVPVGEHGPQHPGRERRVDHVGDAGGKLASHAELVGMPPRQDRGEGKTGQRVGELVRRVVLAGLVGGHPAQAARQPQHGLPVPDRAGLPLHPDRRPGRHQSVDGAGPGVPGEHLIERGVDDAGVFQSHNCGPPRRAIARQPWKQD